ncbi:restriction endonuclease subunit S [Megamonas funiformis]|jgi:type I restriction enzyme S subunit|uniref:restriction endonuclease subunit S n=1 Tax=Megamonas funiformis TaxID=437897 RepID=UPI0022E376B0|nr:restriction endonuclease subunit S [Megamonas funiformis]
MNVPKLRFKEFTDKWQKVPLNLFTNIYGGYAFKSENLLNYKAKYQVIKMGNVNNNTLNLEKNPSYLNTISQKELPYLLEKNDIILTLTGTFGKKDFGYSYQIKNETNLLLNQRLAVFKITNSNYSANFLKYILLNNTFLNKFFRFSVGGTGNQANVSIQDIKSFKIPFPKLEEQNKIANFLTTVDKKITNLENTIISLENQKKGLLQQIFSQKLRFKDKNGNNYPNWEKKKLGDIATLKNGISKSNEAFGHGKKFINLQDIFNKSYIFNDNYSLVDVTEKELSENNLLKGDVLFVRSSVKREGVGLPCVIMENLIDTVYSGFIIRCRFNINENIYLHYKKYCFLEFSFRKALLKKSSSSANTNINQDNLSKLYVNLPCLEEQTKIADFLSAFDRKLDNQKAQLEHWKQIKKGLLQQMFV